jgi:hypothetical protein
VANPRPLQARTGQRHQVGAPARRTVGPRAEHQVRRVGLEGVAHLGTDLEGLRTDAGAQPGRQRRRLHTRAFAQRADGGVQHARGQATPAGMGGGHGAAIGRREQHRQAVGHLHRAGDAGLVGPGGIGLGRGAVQVLGAQAQDPRAVHLAQPDRPRAGQAGLEAAPVLGHRRRVVTDGVTQVQ